MERKYKVRAYQPGDEEEIVGLLNLVFDGWPKFDLSYSPLEHWRWKYQNNPFKMNPIVVGVESRTIIGCNHSYSIRIKIGNELFLCTYAGDTAVHSNFRMIGVWKKMLELTINIRREIGTHLNFSVTTNPILIRDLSKLIYRHRFPYAVIKFQRIHDVDLHMRKCSIKYAFLKKYGFHLLKMVYRFRNTLPLSNLSYYDFQIRQITNFDNKINTLWEEIEDHYHFIVERNRDYLNWRYCDPRGGDYLVKIAKENGKILGYIVLRINKIQMDYPYGYIVDLLTLPNRLDVADALIADAVNYFNNNNVNIISCLIIKNHPYEAILKRNGFVGRGGNIPFFYDEYEKIEVLKNLEASSPSKIHFVYGDFDYI